MQAAQFLPLSGLFLFRSVRATAGSPSLI